MTTIFDAKGVYQFVFLRGVVPLANMKIKLFATNLGMNCKHFSGSGRKCRNFTHNGNFSTVPQRGAILIETNIQEGSYSSTFEVVKVSSFGNRRIFGSL